MFNLEIPMATSYVKALYDYHSGETGDLNFSAGDVIQVLNQIDENWIKGEHDGNIGLFPANFVEPLVASAANEKETSASTIGNIVSNTPGKTVVAKETYISGDDGVLTFFRGDELTFLGRVDEYWCQGSFAGEAGLFPAHLVDGLDDVLPPPQLDEPRHQITTATESTTLQENITKPSPHKPHAKTLFNFKGLSNFELSFPAGQIVILTKDVDTEWFEGTYEGSTGIFPKSFVEVLLPLPKGHQLAESQPSSKNQPLPESQAPNIKSEIVDVPYAITVYPFVGETSSELSFREGETIFLHHWVSPEWIKGECNGRIGIFPSTFVQIEKGLPQDFEELSGAATLLGEGATSFGDGEGLPHAQEEIVYSFKTGDKALAIYSYASDIEGDLRFEVGDMIWIEQIIDEEWVLGRKGENFGLCPAVFLELQSDESKTNQYNETTQRNELGLSESVSPMTSTGPTPVLINSAGSQANHVPSSQNKSIYMGSTSPKTKTSSISDLTISAELKTNHIPSSQTPSSKTASTVTTAPEIQLSPASPLAENPPNQPKTKPFNQTTTKPPQLKPTTLSLGPKLPLAPKPLISPKPDFLKKPVRPTSSPVKPTSSPVKPVLPPKPVTPMEKSPGFSKTNGN